MEGAKRLPEGRWIDTLDGYHAHGLVRICRANTAVDTVWREVNWLVVLPKATPIVGFASNYPAGDRRVTAQSKGRDWSVPSCIFPVLVEYDRIIHISVFA